MPPAHPPANRNLPLPATGLAALDEAGALLGPGTLTVLAGRPGHGADALLNQIMCHTTLDLRIPAVWFDCEATRKYACAPIFAARAAIPRPRLLRNQLSATELARLGRVEDELAQAPLTHHVGVEPPTLNRIDVLLRAAVRTGPAPALVGIDALRLWVDHGQDLPHQVRHLRFLAGELGLAVVATTGIRHWQFRPNATPTVTDVHDERLVRAHATTLILTDHPAGRAPASRRSPHELDLYLHPIAGDRAPLRVSVAYNPLCGQVMDLAPVI